jgi:HK97 family phage major capsid protein
LKTIEQILTEQRAIVDAAEGRALTDEEGDQYEALEAELKATRRSEEIRARQTAYEAPNASLAAGVHVAAVKQDDTLERAFTDFMRTGEDNSDLTELRAQATSSGAAGGYAVPQTWLPKVTERLKAFGGVANVVEVITTDHGEAVRWPTNDDTANVGAIAPEGSKSSGAGADLVFAEKTLGAFTYDALGVGDVPLKVSRELLQDNAYDIEGLITRKLAQRIARKQSADFVNGAGTSAPFGVATNSLTQSFAVTTGTQAITYADLLAAVHSVDIAYRDGAVWTFNDYTMSLIEGIVDGNGRPLLNYANDGISVGRANQYLLGYPVVIDNSWANFADPSTNKWGAFGNLQEGYIIRRVQDVAVFVNPYSSAATRQVEFNLWARADAVVQDPYAYRVLTNVTP